MLIFIDGPDNVGKSTQINNIYKELANRNKVPFWAHYANFGLPKSKVEKFSEEAYWSMFDITFSVFARGNVPILDRSHLGEWVYGKKYRDYDANFIWDLEHEFENSYQTYWNYTYLITFVDKPENLIARDDNLSFSVDINDKQWEVDRFIDAHDRSIIRNKLILNIDGLSEELVWERVRNFLWSS